MFVDFDFNIIPAGVVSSYRLLKSSIGVTTRQNGRKHWGLVLKAVGQTIYSQNGREFLSDRTHVMLLPQGSRYNWKCLVQGECFIIDFDAPESPDAIFSFEISDPGYFFAAHAKIEKCLSQDHPAGRLEAMQHLCGILLFLAKAAGQKHIPKQKHQLLAPALDYMTEHYADPEINNTSLASLCGISTVYFRKTFEAVYGSSPIRYLHDLRISKAKAILIGDYGSIGQIAESVGYNSVYHFSKMFRQYTGQSPTDYARTVRL